MFQRKIEMAVMTSCFAISVVFCLYYLSTTHFEFMLALFHYMKFNISSVSYTLFRFAQILMAIFLLVPKIKLEKAKRLKYIMYIMGILYITGSTWIIYFLANNPISMLGDIDATTQYLKLNALNFGYLIWDSYDGFSILFSLIEAGLFIAMGYYIDKRRRKPITLYWISLALSMGLPFLYVYVISGTGAFSSMWLQKNIVLFVAQAFMGAGLTVAGRHRMLWEEVIWG